MISSHPLSECIFQLNRSSLPLPHLVPVYLCLNFIDPLIKLNLTVVYIIHVTAHPYTLAEFMITVVSIHVFESLKGNSL